MHATARTTLLTTLFLSAALTGCGETSPSAKQVQTKMGETWDAMKTWGAEKRDALVKKTDEGLKSLEKPMADAKAAAGAAGSDAAQALDAAWKKTEEKLSALKSASGEGFAKARDEMVEAYEALRAFADPQLAMFRVAMMPPKASPEALGILRKAFTELWKNADTELQPQVAEVRRRMAKLAGES